MSRHQVNAKDWYSHFRSTYSVYSSSGLETIEVNVRKVAVTGLVDINTVGDENGYVECM